MNIAYYDAQGRPRDAAGRLLDVVPDGEQLSVSMMMMDSEHVAGRNDCERENIAKLEAVQRMRQR